jgi:hypothetical protein
MPCLRPRGGWDVLVIEAGAVDDHLFLGPHPADLVQDHRCGRYPSPAVSLGIVCGPGSVGRQAIRGSPHDELAAGPHSDGWGRQIRGWNREPPPRTCTGIVGPAIAQATRSVQAAPDDDLRAGPHRVRTGPSGQKRGGDLAPGPISRVEDRSVSVEAGFVLGAAAPVQDLRPGPSQRRVGPPDRRWRKLGPARRQILPRVCDHRPTAPFASCHRPRALVTACRPKEERCQQGCTGKQSPSQDAEDAHPCQSRHAPPHTGFATVHHHLGDEQGTPSVRRSTSLRPNAAADSRRGRRESAGGQPAEAWVEAVVGTPRARRGRSRGVWPV